MTKPIAIIAGEPNSISSEIIFKSWKLRKQYAHKPLLVIGSFKLLNSQKKKLKYQIRIKKINDKFRINDLKGEELPVYDVKYNQKEFEEEVQGILNFIPRIYIMTYINLKLAQKNLDSKTKKLLAGLCIKHLQLPLSKFKKITKSHKTKNG